MLKATMSISLFSSGGTSALGVALSARAQRLTALTSKQNRAGSSCFAGALTLGVRQVKLFPRGLRISLNAVPAKWPLVASCALRPNVVLND